VLAEPELLEALRALTPTAFECWMAERFRELGYSVQLTLASSDHGIDLRADKEGETVVVQCKRYRATTVGEPILRDLYGAMHHSGAHRAILVTTGRLTPAALEWTKGKAVETWDGHELVRRWPAEIAELTRQQVAGVSDQRVKAKRGDNWYVYAMDDGRRWGVKVSPLIGNNPALGFERLDDPTLPELSTK
jgi:restriction endonuclease Mrr